MKATNGHEKHLSAELTDMLKVHLANTYSLMLRLQNYHWNVEGPQFMQAHELFEHYYTAMWKSVDVIAERIRALDEYVPGNLRDFYDLAQITDRSRPEDLDGMLEDLITCFIVTRQFAGETLKTAGVIPDEVTSDMLINQMKILEKGIWMLRSSRSREHVSASAVRANDKHKAELLNENINGEYRA